MAGQAIVLVVMAVALSQPGVVLSQAGIDATKLSKAWVDTGPYASPATADQGCVVFDNQAEFETFNEQQGLLLKGIETFEECNLPPNSVAAFDDPLCGGIPSSPTGSPFPNGLDQLNLCVQSNALGGAPDVPKPSDSGIRAISVGFQGAVSDIVTSGTFVHSFDMILSGPSHHTSVGLNPIGLLGGSTAEIRVYSQNESLLVTETVPADAAGSSFFGVSCPQSIGRINFFDPGNGIEGADNIQMWVTPQGECGDDTCEPGETCENCPEDCGPCPFCGDGKVNQPIEECDPPGFPSSCPNNEACLADCTCGDFCGDELCSGDEDECNCPQDCRGICDDCLFFDNQADFEAFNVALGMTLRGVEDFEEANLFGTAGIDDPLCGGIPSMPPGSPFPNGLNELNICVQSNFEHNPATPNPRGIYGLVAVSIGNFGVLSDIVLALEFVDSLDLIFTEPQPIALGFNPISLFGDNLVEVRVYDKDNFHVASGTSSANAQGQNFWGVWCPHGMIGRINIFDTGDGAEGGDNIQMWVTQARICPGDLTGDGVIDAADLAALLGSWGPCNDCPADLNGDGVVNATDLAQLLGAWGTCQ